MGQRQRTWARKAYDKLILSLGGKCVHCGAVECLTIDHINGKDYDACALEWSRRVSRYRQEARSGLLQVLCSQCNCVKGDPSGQQEMRLVEYKPQNESDPF